MTASEAGRRQGRRHVHVRVEQLAVAVGVQAAADAPQPQPLGDGEHDVQPHRRLAEAAEHDLVGRPVHEGDLDRPA